MSRHRFSRTEMLIGEEGLAKLKVARVIVFGVGGVGSYTVEALARAGIGELTLVDFDTVDVTNINRQLHAMDDTIGSYKVDLMAERIKHINPEAIVTPIREFYSPQNGDDLIKGDYSYVVDAIDNVTGKLDIIKRCYSQGLPVISCMGAGNKLDPAAFRVADISETSVDPLARVMRRELRKAQIEKGVKVVFSVEPPITPQQRVVKGETAISLAPGSISFVPAAAGLVLAGAVVRGLL
ncbi:tRNA threonylcarbamoyladenosine dehydratase [Desulforamulus aeronauticus]|uniref:tRNA A37 threonylcarbamoyladenosine dehydratase n=1 Tax=Desulforamulus aeronauticus DSM 10349 TaxID=1121421 RepID=A0A1M6PL73_9FIRM|nr:tRNA threonylcarbamoyladenosine dehydratase [Desulforamulus aeronauticus]SHK08648.1 tRNA A37 threonylcarbamoyladenosine dehydratase [Desulforamulus aeronauticus DSM 10349]